MEDYFSPVKKHTVDYGDNPRSELIEFIRDAPESVLEIGCGRGAFGEGVKRKFPNIRYVGLEIDEQAAHLAKERLDKVIVCDIEKTDPGAIDIERESFEWIICADVLEHLYDPWKVMHILHSYLKPGGKLLASIPNTQNISLILQLLDGKWTYTQYGLLDATHIRFFTLNEIYKLFSGTGYRVIDCASIMQYQLEDDNWPRDMDFGKVVMKQITKEEAAMFFTFQYIIVAQKLT
jgi:2-polyprenyl-3-methyl-5-hydroxy-6-metoxy-1,4-benzoquinol methylase